MDEPSLTTHPKNVGHLRLTEPRQAEDCLLAWHFLNCQITEHVSLQGHTNDTPRVVVDGLVDSLNHAIGAACDVIVHDVVIKDDGSRRLDLLARQSRIRTHAFIVVCGIDIDHIEESANLEIPGGA